MKSAAFMNALALHVSLHDPERELFASSELPV
jgi:hypothetical protein